MTDWSVFNNRYFGFAPVLFKPMLKKVIRILMARKADPEKKDNIICAAIPVFARKGYAATRIIDVARSAGIGKGTVYEYFSSKEDLFFSVFQQIMQDSETQMAEAAASNSGSVAGRLKIMADVLITTWLEKLELYSLVMEFWSATTASVSRERFKSAFQAGYQAFREAIADLIREGIDRGEFSRACRPVAVASGFIGMCDALLLQAWLDETFDALGSSRACMDVMLRGLSTLQDEEPTCID